HPACALRTHPRRPGRASRIGRAGRSTLPRDLRNRATREDRDVRQPRTGNGVRAGSVELSTGSRATDIAWPVAGSGAHGSGLMGFLSACGPGRAVQGLWLRAYGSGLTAPGSALVTNRRPSNDHLPSSTIPTASG